MRDLTTLRQNVDKKLAALNLARQSCRKLGEELSEAEKQAEAATEAQELAQQVAQTIQQKAHDQIAGVVSRCLSAVFDEPYTFRIHFERKRGRTEARMIFERNGFEVDPLTESGGGVVDVAALALRLSCIMLNKPPLRRVVILDEPFKCGDEYETYRPRVRELLETLADELGFQFIIVTHMRELRTGTVLEVE